MIIHSFSIRRLDALASKSLLVYFEDVYYLIHLAILAIVSDLDKGLITYLPVCLYIQVIACSIYPSAAIGEDCTHNDNCTEIGQVCDTTCVCHTASNYKQIGNKCVKGSVNFLNTKMLSHFRSSEEI
jgi:hypothetical protein